MVLGQENVNVRALAACLSVADICHADASRAPLIVFKYLDLDEESSRHWRRHLQISGVTRRDDAIAITALVFTNDGEDAVQEFKRSIEDQLNLVSPYFRNKLARIASVDLQIRQLSSPVQRTLQFHPDMSAILRVLVEGVYGRADVFIRELVQNSLDACYLRYALCMRRAQSFIGKIILTIYTRHPDGFVVFRIDDNGIGIDIDDLEDTVLCLGRSSAQQESVQRLLEQTTGKNLIATFGVGLLSCFKVAERLIIISCKEGRTPIEVSIDSISDKIRPQESEDRTVGTTILVYMKPEMAAAIDADAAFSYYLRAVSQVQILSMCLEWDEERRSSRSQIFTLSTTEAQPILPQKVRSAWAVSEVQGDDYHGMLWLDTPLISASDAIGVFEILSDGIFVSENPSDEWLPDFARYISGRINFAAKAIDLAVSRDKIIENHRYFTKKEEMAARSMAVIREVIRKTTSAATQGERKSAAITLSIIFSQSDYIWKEKIYRELDEYAVYSFGFRSKVLLREIRRQGKKVFIAHKHAHVVEKVTVVDGREIYGDTEEILSLQARVLTQKAHVVIHADSERGGEYQILEADMIMGYLKYHNVDFFDLREEVAPEANLRPVVRVPGRLRSLLGDKVRFVDQPETPNKRSWIVKGQLWINEANPQMRRMRNRLYASDATPDQLEMLRILVMVLSWEIDEAVDGLVQLAD
jgi:hypothetical protein